MDQTHDFMSLSSSYLAEKGPILKQKIKTLSYKDNEWASPVWKHKKAN